MGWRARMLLVTGMVLLATPARAQMLTLGTWDGSLEGITEISRQKTATEGGESSRFERMRSEERLTLRNSGAWIYHPGLATFSLGATFGLSQDRLTSDGKERTDDLQLYGYDAFLSLLRDQPVALNAFATRTQESISREFAGHSELLTETEGGTLFLRRLYIPSSLTVRQERQEEDSTIGTQVARRADRRTTVRYEGQRGWVDQELSLAYEFVDDRDEMFPTLSFQSQDAQVAYSLDFGDELNWRWDSRLRYTTRTGIFSSTFLTAEELLRIEHSNTLQTHYRYAYLSATTDSTATATTTHVLSAGLQHQLGQSLMTTAGVDATRQTLTGGAKDSATARADLAYTKRLPLGGRLDVYLGGSFRYEDDRFEATETTVSGESHTAATPLAIALALDNRFAVASSIVVTKTATGPIPLGCLAPGVLPAALTAGVDYNVQVTGDVTEIVPRACTAASLGINPGDTIAVDYRFTVGPARTFTTKAWHSRAAVDYGWFALSAGHEESRQDLVSGRADGFLDNQTLDTLGAELRYPGTRAHASLTGELRRFRSTRTVYDSVRAGVSADFLLLPGLTARLSADRTVTTFTREDRQTESLSGRAGLSYTFSPTLSMDLNGGVLRLEDSRQPTQQTTNARFVLRWLFRKLEITPTLEYYETRRGDSMTNEYRGILRTIRRF